MQGDRIRWWNLYHDDQECVGKIQLSIGSTITCDDTNNIKVSLLVIQIAEQNLIFKIVRVLISSLKE